MAQNDGGKKPVKPKQTGGRNARLAAALRENLRRRKAQERRRGTPSLAVAAKPDPDGRPDR